MEDCWYHEPLSRPSCDKVAVRVWALGYEQLVDPDMDVEQAADAACHENLSDDAVNVKPSGLRRSNALGRQGAKIRKQGMHRGIMLTLLCTSNIHALVGDLETIAQGTLESRIGLREPTNLSLGISSPICPFIVASEAVDVLHGQAIAV